MVENLQRLEPYLTEVRRVLNNGGCGGAEISFLIQECNREMNTSGSKSLDNRYFKTIVELKRRLSKSESKV